MNQYLEKHLKPLIGQKIIGLIEDPEGGFYGFRVEGGVNVWVLCDPEGNGPGHLDIVKDE